jgi:hypothetical protein
VTEWDKEPLIPRAVTVKLPVAEFDDAPNTMAVFEPEAMVSGFTGFDRTPLGKPVRVTWTEPAKPFWPATETVMGALVPCGMERELEEKVIAKSGDGAGGGWTIADVGLPPPPQPAHTKDSRGKNLRRFAVMAPLRRWLRVVRVLVRFLNSKPVKLIVKLINIAEEIQDPGSTIQKGGIHGSIAPTCGAQQCLPQAVPLQQIGEAANAKANGASVKPAPYGEVLATKG